MNVGPSIGRPRFVTTEDALAWHETAIAQYGGASGVRDLGLLDSALAQPRQGFGGQYAHAFPFEMAAAYAYHIAKNHPFYDGNKRTALLCAGGFLRMNGWDLVSEGTAAADAILALVAGEFDKSSFAVWLQAHSRCRPMLELRDFFASLSAAGMQRLRDATVAGRDPQMAASGQEAMRAIPLIADLLAMSESYARQHDPLGEATAAGQAVLLILLYRIAEDMGYEW